jgi:1-pyrroline-5-carboxylate dehydrogenase
MTTNAVVPTPIPSNEPVRAYAPGSPERSSLKAELERQWHETLDIPLVVGGAELRTGNTRSCVSPHDHRHVLGQAHQAGAAEIEQAIGAAAAAHGPWNDLDFEDRAAILLRAADLLAGPWRDRVNAATMLGQSKTAHQAEIDSACELIDFFRYNVFYARQILEEQPGSNPGMWNRMDYRGLEGFVAAITPFNFSSIAGNLPTAAALMGCTVLWKPASTALPSAWAIMELLREAGLPEGVINFVPGAGSVVGPTMLEHPQLAGVHFTGSTGTFHSIWRTAGSNIARYRNYPRLVGETGGKDFIVAHPSAQVDALATAIVRGGYEYQGQKCSAASRIFLPDSLAGPVLEGCRDRMATLKMGDVRDFTNFLGAVIDASAFADHSAAIDEAKNRSEYEVLAGGEYDDSTGYFVSPTLIRSNSPTSRLMVEELFGPIVTVHVYPDGEFEETLRVVDQASPYALTGAIFSRDRKAVVQASRALRYTAGNFYINDKPTGAVVGQQPFGGARASGTNDKAGSALNLLRWTSPRTIKETFVPPTDHRYPFLEEE